MPEDTTLELQAGDRFRLSKSGRRNVYEFGLGSATHGSLYLFASGDLALKLGDAEYKLRTQQREWDLALLDLQDKEQGRYEAAKRGAGTITTPNATYLLTPPKRRTKTGELADATDGTPIAELRIQGGVVLFELFRPADPLAIALAASVVVLRTAYEPPDPAEIRPVWKPARAAWWGAALATGWMHADQHDLSWPDSGFADSNFGGGSESGI